MTEYEFILFDRITKIKSTIAKYGEENFYISFSGGKDSSVLSALFDMALPGNRIPRVFANTGIELNMIRDFVKAMAEKDDRIVIIKPSVPIKQMLEEVGYPFKSKHHAKLKERFDRIGLCDSVKKYVSWGYEGWNKQCPKILRYQFESGGGQPGFKISDKCCFRLKEDPLKQWQKENGKPYAVVGIMKDEGGRRDKAQCLAFENNKLKAFQPLVPVSKKWEDWFIEAHNIKICDIYKPPYDFDRTGCKGCPFAINLQHELDVLERYFPNERKQCEIIWKPVYNEYRRLGYRLRKSDYKHEDVPESENVPEDVHESLYDKDGQMSFDI